MISPFSSVMRGPTGAYIMIEYIRRGWAKCDFIYDLRLYFQT